MNPQAFSEYLLCAKDFTKYYIFKYQKTQSALKERKETKHTKVKQTTN